MAVLLPKQGSYLEGSPLSPSAPDPPTHMTLHENTGRAFTLVLKPLVIQRVFDNHDRTLMNLLGVCALLRTVENESPVQYRNITIALNRKR